jgi:dihydrofolate reductase
LPSDAPGSALALIVAYARDRVIGRDGALPWHYREDLQHFKRETTGHAIVMGRKTHESIGRPLPGRRNLVVTRQGGYASAGCEFHGSLASAIAAARESDDCPFVIGGAQIYALALPLATRLVITEVQRDVEGDVFFPAFEEADWVEVRRTTALDGELVFRWLRRA